MSHLVPLLACLALSAAAPKADPLAAARAALDSGDYEKVLDVVGAAEGADPAALAALLTRAGQVALDKQDREIASIFCEMAIKRTPGEKATLELCVKVAVAKERWEDVDAWGEALAKLAPKDPDLAVQRAQAALAQGEWKRASDLLEPHAKGPRSAEVAPLLAQAEQHRKEEGAAADQQKALEARLKKALAEARALDRAAPDGPSASATADGVVLYTTTWCGVCKKAKAWLEQNKIPFTEKDVEKERGATQELAAKCKKAHLRPGGVPVLDARGKLLVGFDPGEYARALQ